MDLANTGAHDAGLAGTSTIAAIFHDHDKVQQAVTDLMAAGFRRDQIGVAVKASESSRTDESWIGRIREMFTDKNEKIDPDEASYKDYYSSSYAPDTLQSMGVERSYADHLRNAMNRGDTLVTVRAGARQQDAIAILQQNGAEIGTQTATGTAPGFAAERATTTGRDIGTEMAADQRLQLYGELLRVHKERIRTGEVRLRKEVVTERKQIEVPVEHEELIVERIPGNEAPAHAADFGTDKEIRIPLTEEKVRVEKQPVVNEEVRVGKRQVTSTERVDDTVRHEEVRVENQGNVNVTDSKKIKSEDLNRREKKSA